VVGEVRRRDLADEPPVGQLGVVVHRHAAVQRAPHVELDPVGPHGHGRLEGEQRVLGGGGTGAPVGEDEGHRHLLRDADVKTT
jgi:hypothetical protein